MGFTPFFLWSLQFIVPKTYGSHLQKQIESQHVRKPLPPGEISDTPKETSHTPRETFYTPKETSDTPRETSDTPKETSDTPKETFHTSLEIAATPKETSHTPKENIHHPKKIPSKQIDGIFFYLIAFLSISFNIFFKFLIERAFAE